MRVGTTKRGGFTIVELLIVIVVIGILAAITIIAYTGITSQARQAQLLGNVETYAKALSNYKTLNGDYPYTATSNDPSDAAGSYAPTDPSNPGEYACLGNDWPAQDGMAANVCLSVSGAMTADVGSKSPLINTKLKTVISNLPSANADTATFDNGAGLVYHYRGLIYDSKHNNATGATVTTISFIRPGNQTVCGTGVLTQGTFSGVLITQCQVTLK
jgi:prepilin-type N-terminal cleavage/methylation domain-containing protein